MRIFSRILQQEKGFTLIELLIVIAILGILAAIALPRFGNTIAAANTAKIQADLRTIDAALISYYAAERHEAPLGEIKSEHLGKYLVSIPKPPTGDYIDQSGALQKIQGSYLIVKSAATANEIRATLDGKTSDQYGKS